MTAAMALYLMCASGIPCARADEFAQTFGERGFDSKLFRPTGNPRVFQRTADGLRITMPEDHGSSLPAGLIPRLGVRGDFEITMAFEIIKVDTPTAGGGAGVSIYITQVSATQEAASIAWQVRKGGERVFLAHRATTPPGGKRTHDGKRVSTDVLWGRLALVRKGTSLSYLMAPGASEEFQQLYQTEWGNGDLDTVRFAADNGGSPTLVDVRVHSVNIRGDFGSARRPQPSASRWPLWLAISLVVILLAAGGFWFRSRSK
jgi:hypothetical protein